MASPSADPVAADPVAADPVAAVPVAAVPPPLALPVFKERLGKCIHCGLCLPACPTYDLFRTEMDSPRGRIALMRAAAEGRIETTGAFEKHIDLCLGCRACEPACPSGVEYGALLATAREAIEASRQRPLAQRLERRFFLHRLLPQRGRLRLLARLARGFQRLGLIRVARQATWLPERLKRLANLLPDLTTAAPYGRRPALPLGEKRGKVAFFRGCVQDAFLARVNAATVSVLQLNGYEVHFPSGQTCCGAAAHHAGESGLAHDLAKRNLEAFDPNGFDAILNNAGGCGAMLKESRHLFEDDPAMAETARRFAAKTRDICEFLAENLHRPPRGEVALRATYADSCHLRHAQGVVEAPRDLLRRIPGLELRELARPDACCGSAGVYNLEQPDTAERVLAAKMEDIRDTGADVIVTTNTGCHLQLLSGVRTSGSETEVLHLVELLERSYVREAAH